MIGLLGFFAGFTAVVAGGCLWQLRQIRSIMDLDRAIVRNKLRHIEQELLLQSSMTNHKNTAANIATARRKRGGL